MTHGGTSWGHWAGANSPGFAPDVTSYDYDAPINEAGQVTDKFWKLREAMQKYSGEWDPVAQKWVGSKKLPAVPKEYPTIAIPKFGLNEFKPLIWGADSIVERARRMTFEEMNFGWGSMMYVTELPDIPVQSVMKLEAHDYAQVFINGKFIGKIDRVKHETSIILPPVQRNDDLMILVEGMGRINFGRAIKDFKGLVSDVVITAEIDNIETTWTPRQWDHLRIQDDYATAVRAFQQPEYTKGKEFMPEGVGYYRGYFNLKKVGDTFLNLENWGKGQVYVNGHAIGRHWYIGPQQTLYVPGCWLKKGQNEVIVLDVMGPRGEKTIEGLQKPIIDKLNLDRPQTHRLEGQTLDLTGEKPVMEGEFKPGNGWQEVKFPQPVSGRYVCIEALNSHNNREYCCIAEWYMLGADGTRLSREPWQVAYCDDEDIESGNKTADKIFDLQESTYWSTNRGVQFPHYLIIDLGQDQTFTGFQYLPRVEAGAPESIRQYRIYVKSSEFKM